MSGEQRRTFACFGGSVTVQVGGAEAGGAAKAAELGLLDAHRRLSRFLPESELTRLNDDPRSTVPVSPLLLELAAAVRRAGFLSGGLVDATLVGQIEAAGYRESLADEDGWRLAAIPEVAGPDPSPPGRAPSAAGAWSPSTAARAPSAGLPACDSTAVASPRVCSPTSSQRICASSRASRSTAAGTSASAVSGDGRGRCSSRIPPAASHCTHWRCAAAASPPAASPNAPGSAPTDRRAHHLLDPRSGAPAFTGVVQATAQAPTAFLAEVYSKLALLSGPERAPGRLPFGGVLVLDDGSVEVVETRAKRPPAAVAR